MNTESQIRPSYADAVASFQYVEVAQDEPIEITGDSFKTLVIETAQKIFSLVKLKQTIAVGDPTVKLISLATLVVQEQEDKEARTTGLLEKTVTCIRTANDPAKKALGKVINDLKIIFEQMMINISFDEIKGTALVFAMRKIVEITANTPRQAETKSLEIAAAASPHPSHLFLERIAREIAQLEKDRERILTDLRVYEKKAASGDIEAQGQLKIHNDFLAKMDDAIKIGKARLIQ